MFIFLILTILSGSFSSFSQAQDLVPLSNADSFSTDLKAYVESYQQDDIYKKIIFEQKIKDTIFDLKYRDAYESRLRKIDTLAGIAEKARDWVALTAYIELARDLQLRWQLSYSESYFSHQRYQSTTQRVSFEAVTGIALTMALLKVKPQKIPALLVWMRRLRSYRVVVGVSSTAALASDQSPSNYLGIPEAPAEILHFGHRDLREESGTRSLSLLSEDERLILLEIAVDTAGWAASAAVVTAWARSINATATITKWNPYVLIGSLALGLAAEELIPMAAEKIDEEQLRHDFLNALRDWKEKLNQDKRWTRWKAARELSDSALALHRFWLQKEMKAFQEFNENSKNGESKTEEINTFFESFKNDFAKKAKGVPIGIFSYLNQKQAYDFWLGLHPRYWEMSLSKSTPPIGLALQPVLLRGWKQWKLASPGGQKNGSVSVINKTENSQSTFCDYQVSQEFELEQAQAFSFEVRKELILHFIKKCDAKCSFSDGISPLILVASLFEIQKDPGEMAESEKLWTLIYQWNELKKLL